MPFPHAQMTVRLDQALAKIRDSIYTPLAPLTIEAWITPEPVSYADRQTGMHRSFAVGERWGSLWDCAWFHFTGTVPKEDAGKAVVLLIDLSGEACLFDPEGVPILGLSPAGIGSVFDTILGN